MSDLFDSAPGIVQDRAGDENGRPASTASRSRFVSEQIKTGAWTPAVFSADVLGLTRDLPVYLAERKTDPVVHDWHGDAQTHCPPLYWDLAIGSGSCGLGCRSCYLLGTFRDRRDPYRPVLYDNVAFIWNAARRWLLAPRRLPVHSLGLSTDRSDSLLFEGAFGHARELVPMFADPVRNPRGAKLLLLTKSRNAHYLRGLPTKNVIVSFSLNPEPVAELWEGKWPDTLERITPPIADRLQASLEAQRMGFEVRWRLDPILTPEGWLEHYRDFLSQAAAAHHEPTRITLGTYRESTPQLHRWRSYWKVPDMEWKPPRVQRDGTHWHVPAAERVVIYKAIAELCARHLPRSVVSICKETKDVRRATGLVSPACNCLGDYQNALETA
jgi:DNA repair photolyase